MVSGGIVSFIFFQLCIKTITLFPDYTTHYIFSPQVPPPLYSLLSVSLLLSFLTSYSHTLPYGRLQNSNDWGVNIEFDTNLRICFEFPRVWNTPLVPGVR